MYTGKCLLKRKEEFKGRPWRIINIFVRIFRLLACKLIHTNQLLK